MAGIYIHVPWCRKVCVYCDFHFSVSMRNKSRLIECMLDEIELQRDYLNEATIESVYFGGGTPSVLNPDELHAILDKICSRFNLSANAEISLEANPDDLSLTYLRDLNDLGINRLSIGVQSFFDDDLAWMNRRHNRDQSVNSVEISKKAGFDNISIDLIYGIPGMKPAKWKENLIIAFNNQINHLSAYHLTLEKKTVYFHKVSKGVMEEPDETAGLQQYEILMDIAEREGFLHYEISNFCLPGRFSVHNTSYWLQKHYLGIGPSANSFNGRSRQWNIRNNSLYINKIEDGIIPCESEDLDLIKRYNEYVLTSLRTMWGTDRKVIKNNFGDELSEYFNRESRIFIDQGKIEQSGSRVMLGRSGKFIADGIISQLFWTGNGL
jgi:oxygen-independent coproporphyrinogen III oxidase